MATADDVLENGCAILPVVLDADTVSAAGEVVYDLVDNSASLTHRANGRKVSEHPTIAPLLELPATLDVVRAVIGIQDPLLLYARAVYAEAGHPREQIHSNHYSWDRIIPEPAILSVCFYLDQIDHVSGQFAYVPGSHKKYYEPNTVVPTWEDVEVGEPDLVDVTANAGDVLFRLPEVWHTTRDIAADRRYVAGFYVNPDRAVGQLADRINRRSISLKGI